MGGDAQDFVRPQKVPGGARLQVRLSHVDAVGPGFQGDVHPVVDDADDALPAAQGGKLLRLRQEHGLVQMLLPQLHDGRAAVNGLFNLAEEGVLVRRPGPVGDGIEPQTLSDDVHAGILLVKNRGYAAYGISAVLRDYFPTLA